MINAEFDADKFWNNVRWLIKHRSPYTYQSFQMELGASRIYLSNSQYQRSVPNVAVGVKMARMLKVRVEDLMFKDFTKGEQG